MFYQREVIDLYSTIQLVPKIHPAPPFTSQWAKHAKIHFYEENINRTNKLKHLRPRTEVSEQNTAKHCTGHRFKC